jgi:hypothetical protein
MTEAQKNKVVDILAKDAAKAEKKMVKMDLLYEHTVNGVHYGPGMTDVPEELHGHFIVGDNNFLKARLRENMSTSTELEILSKGISRVISRKQG